MTAGRNVARAAVTALATIVVLIAALQGSALAAAPELLIKQPTSGSATNQQTPVFAGTTTDIVDPVTLQIYAGETAGGSPVQPLLQPVLVEISPTEASWEITPASLAPGQYTAVAEQTNAEPALGTSPPVTFTMEAAPVVTLTSPVGGAVLKTSEPTLTGAGGADPWDGQVTIAIHKGSSLAGSVVASEDVSVGSGTWSYSPHLSDGIYTAQATQSDELGDTGTSAAVTFTVDTTAPVVTLTSPGAGALLDSSEPTLSGNAGDAAWDEPVTTVTVHQGGSPAGEVVALESVPVIGGTWSYSVPQLSDGIYTAQAAQRDEAGHTGTSTPVTFTVDTTAPVVTLASPAQGAFVKTSAPTLSGAAGAAPWDHQHVTVAIHEGGSLVGTVVALKSVAVSGGKWSYAASHLGDGTYTAQASQEDDAGHTGISNEVTFTVDTTPPALTLVTPTNGEQLDTSRPTFGGLAGYAAGDQPLVTLKIYKGSSVSGSPIQTLEVTPDGAEWTTGSSAAALPNGAYTALAEQSDEGGNRTERVVIFTVDAHAPQVTLTSPANGSSTSSSSQTVSGAAGTEAGDLPGITVQLYAGSTITGHAPIEAVTVQASNGGWSAVFGGLSPGAYTADAEQSDDLGNVGQSGPVTFTVLAAQPGATVAPSPPVAAFKWIPSNPQTGEPVTLASSSSDGSSPITGYAWALAGNGAFTQGESTITTSFSTPGPHVVQLRVIEANGLSSTVAETIAVASAPVPLMQPFPVVRMSGSFGASGARIGLLAALAPVGSTVTITCRGRGCPAKSQAFVATSPNKSKTGAVTIVFRRFERFLRAGVVLEIRISKHGQIGKFTRFVIHRGKSPSRVDECLNPAGTTPLVCPS